LHFRWVANAQIVSLHPRNVRRTNAEPSAPGSPKPARAGVLDHRRPFGDPRPPYPMRRVRPRFLLPVCECTASRNGCQQSTTGTCEEIASSDTAVTTMRGKYLQNLLPASDYPRVFILS
jgi:hypothetical protein